MLLAGRAECVHQQDHQQPPGPGGSGVLRHRAEQEPQELVQTRLRVPRPRGTRSEAARRRKGKVTAWRVKTFAPSGAKRVQDADALRGEKGARLAAQALGSGETSLGDALWCCANLYSDIKLRLSHKRLMIFTCRDDPHGGDGARDRQARTKASDLKETGQFGEKAASVYMVKKNVFCQECTLGRLLPLKEIITYPSN